MRYSSSASTSGLIFYPPFSHMVKPRSMCIYLYISCIFCDISLHGSALEQRTYIPAPVSDRSQVPLLLYLFEELNDVARLELVPGLKRDTALGAPPHLLHILLALLQSIKFACASGLVSRRKYYNVERGYRTFKDLLAVPHHPVHPAPRQCARFHLDTGNVPVFPLHNVDREHLHHLGLG